MGDCKLIRRGDEAGMDGVGGRVTFGLWGGRVGIGVG